MSDLVELFHSESFFFFFFFFLNNYKTFMALERFTTVRRESQLVLQNIKSLN